MSPCISQHNGLTHSKYVLCCFEETNIYATNTCSTIIFHDYQNVSRCTVHGIHPYQEQTIYSMCYTNISSVTPGRVYTEQDTF